MAARAARLAAGLLAAAVTACVQDDGSRFNPIGDALSISDDDERELGLQFDEQLRQMVVVVEDPLIAGFIHDATGSYRPAFIFAIACCVVSAIGVWMAAPRKVRRVPGKAAS